MCHDTQPSSRGAQGALSVEPLAGSRTTAGERRVTHAVHLVDGTYELFRHYYAVPPARRTGRPARSRRSQGVVGLDARAARGRRHAPGVATDHVIESFRNDCGPATRPATASSRRCSRSFRCSSRRCRRSASSSGRWWSSRRTMRWRPRRPWRPPIRASSGAHLHAGQGPGAVRRRRARRAVRPPRAARCATRPASSRSSACRPRRFPTISRWSATAADGYPGLPGWGAKSAAAVLAQYGHIDRSPTAPRNGTSTLRGAGALAATLAASASRRCCSATSPRCAPTCRRRRRRRAALDAARRRRSRRSPAWLGQPSRSPRGAGALPPA